MINPMKDYSILPLKDYSMTSFNWHWAPDQPGTYWMWIEAEAQFFNSIYVNSIPICLVVTPHAPIVVFGELSNACW